MSREDLPGPSPAGLGSRGEPKSEYLAVVANYCDYNYCDYDVWEEVS